MSIRYPHLFTPLQVGNVTLKNRIMSAPMSIPELTEDYFPTPTDVGYYETRAKGGAASVCVGDCIVHRETGMAHAGLQIALDDPRIVRDMAKIAQAIKWHDCIPSIELNHCGMYGGVPCLANPRATGKVSYGPVDQVMENGIVVKAMDEDMMKMIANAYAEAAARAKMCGFEMIIFPRRSRLAHESVPLPRRQQAHRPVRRLHREPLPLPHHDPQGRARGGGPRIPPGLPYERHRAVRGRLRHRGGLPHC